MHIYDTSQGYSVKATSNVFKLSSSPTTIPSIPPSSLPSVIPSPHPSMSPSVSLMPSYGWSLMTNQTDYSYDVDSISVDYSLQSLAVYSRYLIAIVPSSTSSYTGVYYSSSWTCLDCYSGTLLLTTSSLAEDTE